MASPQREKLASIKSWLKTVLSGNASPVAASKASTSYRPLPVNVPWPYKSWYASETAAEYGSMPAENA